MSLFYTKQQQIILKESVSCSLVIGGEAGRALRCVAINDEGRLFLCPNVTLNGHKVKKKLQRKRLGKTLTTCTKCFFLF